MKKALLVVSVLSLVMGDVALAAKTGQASKKTVKKASVKKSKQVGVKKVALSQVALSANTAAASAPVAAPVAALSGATTVTTVQPAAKPKVNAFGLNWISYNAMNLKNVESYTKNSEDKLDREFYAWEQPTIKYNFNETVNAGVMPQFLHTWFGNPDREQVDGIAAGQLKQPYAMYMGNIALKLTSSKIAILPGGIKLDGQVRYDIPSSEVSQKNGEYGQLWGTVGLARSFGRLDTKLSYIARYYMQQFQTSSLKNSEGQNLQNKSYRQYALLDIGYNITDKLSTTVEIGSVLSYKHADDLTGRLDSVTMNRATMLDVSYAFTKAFTLSVGLSEDSAALNDTRMPFDVTNSGDGGELYIAGTFNI